MPRSGPVRYRRSPHLVCYWQDGRLLLHNYATDASVLGDPHTAGLLDCFDDWLSADELRRAIPSMPAGALDVLLARLVKETLLQRSDRPESDKEQAMATWQAWNPAAGFFHTATRDVEFMDVETAERQLRQRGRRQPMPSSVKRHRGVKRVRLPDGQRSEEFPRTLLARRTWREFGNGPIELASLATLLDLSAGVQRWTTARGEGRVALKTSPSGGARQPIEVYVVALKVNDLSRGIYHYVADRKELERIKAGARATLVERYLPGQWWYKRAAALVLMTAVFPRYLWRYDYARAYRAIQMEAGHVCQTFCLTATWQGLAPFCSAALADSAIEEDLGIDGVTESVVYAAGVGRRPKGSEWAPWPEALDRQRKSRRKKA